MAPRTPRAALLTLLSIVVLDLVGFGVMIPILPYYAESYGASATVLGVLLTCYAFMQLIFAPLWGRLSDRIGRRPVMLVTIAGSAAALLWLGLAPSLVWIFAARILGGVFSANLSVATAYVADMTKAEERTRWMGLIGAAFGVGFVLGPALGGALAPFGYNVPILVAAGLAAVNFFYALVVLKEPPRHRPALGAQPPKLSVLKNPVVRRLCLAYFVFTVAVSQLETIFAFFMMDRFGYDAHQVAYLLVFIAGIMVVIQGGAIRPLARRFGERRLLLWGCFLLATSFLAVPWASPVAVLLVPLAFSGAGRAIAHPAMLSLVSQGAHESHRGAVMGTFQSSASLARVLGPTLAGALFDADPANPFLLAAGLMVVVLLLGLGLPIESPEAAEGPADAEA